MTLLDLLDYSVSLDLRDDAAALAHREAERKAKERQEHEDAPKPARPSRATRARRAR